MMKNLACLLLLISTTVVGQTKNEADSLVRVLPTLPNDTNKVWMLEKLSTIYEASENRLSKEYARKGLDIARQLQFKKGEVMCLLRIGRAYTTKMNYAEGLAYQLKALEIAESIQYKVGIRRVVGQLSRIYRAIGNYDLALVYCFKTLQLARETSIDVDNALRGIGETYMDMNRLDSALYFTQKAYSSIKKGDDARGSGIPIQIRIQLGNIYSKLGQYKTAITYLQESVSYALKADNKPFLAWSYSSLGQVYQQVGNRDSCIYFARKSFDYAEKTNAIPTLNITSTLLAWAYDSVAPLKAVAYYKIAASTRDSLFSQDKFVQFQKMNLDIQRRQQEIAAEKEHYTNQLWRFGLMIGVLFTGIVALILFRNNNLKQKTNQQLQAQKNQIEHTLDKLRDTQTQLIQREKMASLGELTAGIAHEIQNPLNFVNNFSEVSTELVGELEEEQQKPTRDTGLEADLLSNLKENLQKISHHGQRASSIVKGMLEHSHATTGQREATDINALADQYLRLAYQAFQAKDKSGSTGRFSCELITHFSPDLPTLELVPQDMGRVLLNLFNNAFYAVQAKQKQQTKAGLAPDYVPTVTVSTERVVGGVCIRVSDNGTGIPDAVKAKIFQPFFTTKPTGEGTGLGLSLSYDIVTKGHRGTLEVETKEGGFTQFSVMLPC